eukprot:scpid11660/ scgid0521/ Exportin-6-B
MDIGSSSSLSVPLQASLSDDVFATQAGDDLAKDETGSASLSATSTSKLSSGPPLREDSTPAVASKASLSTGSRRGAGSRRSKVSPRSPVRDSQQEQVAMSVPFTSASSDDVSITTTPAETAMDTTSAAVSNDVDDEVAASASPRFSRIRRGGAASPASSQAVAVTVKSDTAEEPRRGLAHASNTATATAATASRGRRSRGRAKTPDVASAETPHAMGVELESSPAVDPSPAAVSVDAAPATGAAVNDDERASTDMTTTGAASVEVDAVNDQVVPEDISVLCNVCKEVVSAHSMYIYCERCSSPVHMLCLLMTEAEINSADSLLCSDCRDKAGANAATDPSAAGAGGAGGVGGVGGTASAESEPSEHQEQFIAIMQAFGHSFLQPDINIFKKNLQTMEDLNEKCKLYDKELFRQMMLTQFINVLLQVLIHKSHDLLAEEIQLAIYHMARTDFTLFFSQLLPQFLISASELQDSQKQILADNFQRDQDQPSFINNLKRFLGDIRYLHIINQSLPKDSVKL